MSIFKYINKDILLIENGIIAHSVNCQLGMGAGLALSIKKKYPIIFIDYIEDRTPGSHNLGDVTSTFINSNLCVCNLFTQIYYGRNKNIKYGNIDAIKKCFDIVINLSLISNLDIHIPKISCGLANLDWDTEVYPALLEICNKNKYTKNIYVYYI